VLDPEPSAVPPADMLHIVVLAGGDDLPAERLELAARITVGAGLVIAADSGFRHAAGLGHEVDVLVGDLDSISRGDLQRAELGRTRIEPHPTDKDLTDLALALDVALRAATDDARPTRVTVVGGDGGRTDHLLGNALLLGAARYAQLRISAIWGAATLHVVREMRTLHREDGELVSLLALHGPASRRDDRGARVPPRRRGAARRFLARAEQPHDDRDRQCLPHLRRAADRAARTCPRPPRMTGTA
jgi:thiamine pyrophosphokinase